MRSTARRGRALSFFLFSLVCLVAGLAIRNGVWRQNTVKRLFVGWVGEFQMGGGEEPFDMSLGFGFGFGLGSSLGLEKTSEPSYLSYLPRLTVDTKLKNLQGSKS